MFKFLGKLSHNLILQKSRDNFLYPRFRMDTSTGLGRLVGRVLPPPDRLVRALPRPNLTKAPQFGHGGRKMAEPGGKDAKHIGSGGGLKEKGEEQEPPQQSVPSTSLFPLFTVSSNSATTLPTGSESPRWLCNPSFTAEVLAARVSSTTVQTEAPFLPYHDRESEDVASETVDGANFVKSTSYDVVVSSSPSDGDLHGKSADKSEPKKRKKGKRKRTRETEGGRPREDVSGRSSKVQAWSGSYGTKPAKDCYVDVRGDPDNLVYGSLYRMNVARYKPHNLLESPNLHFQTVYQLQSRNSCTERESDAEVIDSKLKASGRYCSAKFATWLRLKGLKHAKFIGNEKSSVIPQDFISLSESDLQMFSEEDNAGETLKREIEVSWEDEMLQKTREFNKRTRDFPHDDRVWLDFAEFQDKIASTQSQKAARLQTLERKISIMEKAVELNPDNEELLLCLLNAYQKRDSGDILIQKWAKFLMQHSGCFKLWMEFLHVCREDFSKFQVSEIRKTYAHAIQALYSACNKPCRQAAESKFSNSEVAQLEIGLVDIFVNLCRFEWQSGFRELATGLFQAEIEYSLFCPSLLLSFHNKQKLFEHFWNSDGGRVGEDGAVGWSGWLEQEEENRHNMMVLDIEETEAGGWSGWFEPSSKIEDLTRALDTLGENSMDMQEENSMDMQEEDLEMEEYHEKNDETLLKKLGIDVNAEPQSEMDTTTWTRWVNEEISRDSEQWMPVREKSVSTHLPDRCTERNEQLSRVILYEDVGDYLFSLTSEEARFCLVSQFIDFFGGKVSPWTCTNSVSWAENNLSLEEVPRTVLEDLKDALQITAYSSCQNLESVFGHETDVLRKVGITKFVRNAVLLCMKTFPRNYMLEEAVLVAEELCSTLMNPLAGSVANSRALARSLLKNDRQDFLLCGIYAQREAAHGNIDLARRVFDMALLSISGLPLNLQGNAPLLYFWYADMEMSQFLSSGVELFSQRSSYILSCMGSNMNYEPFKCPPSSLQLLRARQGFKEQINCLRPLWARGDISEGSIALICSASLLEILTTSWAAGLEIIENAFSMVLPGRRSHSLQLESLFNYFLGLLKRLPEHHELSKVWNIVLQGVQNYPCSSKAFSVLVKIGSLYTVQHKIRHIFDEYCLRKPSVTVILFALSFELGKAGSQHRIRGIFERALSNNMLRRSVILWRCYLAYEIHVADNPYAARRNFYRAIHACPWSKTLWLDGFQKLSAILTAKELSDLHEVMRDKELNLRTDIYEILLEGDN